MTREKRIPLAAMKGAHKPIEGTLPTEYFKGIGALIVAHAILETEVSHLLYDLAGVSYPAGRVALGHRNAADRFQTVINLLDMHGISPSIDLKRLKEDIVECCRHRDTFAHNVWVKDKVGRLRINVAKGTVSTPDGKYNFQFVPGAQLIPKGYFASARNKTLRTKDAVFALKQEVKKTLHVAVLVIAAIAAGIYAGS